MKKSPFQSLWAAGLFVLLLVQAIINLKKDPADNFTLFGIIFFTAMITGIVTSAVVRYMIAKKKMPSN